jgi:4'-phosphopantetheinyl transferase
MIYIFYTKSIKKLDDKTFNHFFQLLPSVAQKQILRFKFWQDKQRSLLGKALLIKSFEALELDYEMLADLKYTEFQKPYLNHQIDFNISHSAEYVICAISKTNRVGVDIEEIKEIPLLDFENFFSKEEINHIFKANDSLKSFYTLWTQKEAYLKAIGTGLNVPLSDILISDNKIKYNNEEWFLHELKFDPKYVCHLTTDTSCPDMFIEEIKFD